MYVLISYPPPPPYVGNEHARDETPADLSFACFSGIRCVLSLFVTDWYLLKHSGEVIAVCFGIFPHHIGTQMNVFLYPRAFIVALFLGLFKTND